MAIGSRSQSAKTYLEKHMNQFPDSTLYELINHGIKALASTLPNEVNLNKKNLSIGIVGKDHKFKCLDEEETEAYINPDDSHGTHRPDPPSDSGAVGSSLRRLDEPAPPNEPRDPIPIVAMDERMEER